MEESDENDEAEKFAGEWIEQANRGDLVIIDGRQRSSAVMTTALEILVRACEDGTCNSVEKLHIDKVDDESVAPSLQNLFQSCPNLREVRHKNAAHAGYRLFMQAINDEVCHNIQILSLPGLQMNDSDVAALGRAIENGNLKNLRNLDVGSSLGEVPQRISDAVVLALTNGECPNLESVNINGKCDASNAEKFVHAIADEHFPKMKHIDESLMELRNYLSVLQVPEEFGVQDNETILTFLREGWEHGTERLSVVKVVITGPGRVGKTCLVSRLAKDEFPEDSRMTNGVDVTRTVQDGGLELVYYDFGGQPVYATTHQLFLRTRAVFLVAWDSRTETSDFMHQSFHQYAQDLLDTSPEAQIIFITTKADEEGSSPLSIDEQVKLQEMYHGHFVGYFHVSALSDTDEGTKHLKNAISALADSVLRSTGGEHGFASMSVTKAHVKLKEMVKALRDEANKFYLTTDDWEELAEEAGIVEKEQVARILSLFHEMGEVLRLPTGQIIVDPPKLSDVLARVVTHDERYKQNARGGYLRHNELDDIWEDYDKELRRGFLQLLHECEVGYPIHDDDGKDYGATLIPAMLYNESETMQSHVEHLKSNHHELKPGPQIVVELSTQSSRFGPKFLAKLRGVSVIGGEWRNGCIVVDMVDAGRSRSVRSFGTVSWNVGTGTVITILMYGDIRPLRRQVLEVLGSCLEDFPKTKLIGLTLECSPGPNSHGSWAKDVIVCTSVDPDPEEHMALVRKKPIQGDLNKVMTVARENSLLDILKPCAGAQFKGIFWNSVHHAEHLTKKFNFKQVTLPKIGSVWVHKDEEAYFTAHRQTKLSDELANKVAESIKSSREDQRETKRPRMVYPDLPSCIDNPHELKDSGQAKVYRGVMVGTDGALEGVAVKVFKKESDWDACKNEVMLLLDSGHDNVMRVLAAFFEKPLAPKPCFVMRFIPGGSLRDHLDKHGKFVGNEAIQLLKGIGEGLRHLHSLGKGIVHRDLKSLNILLESLGDSLRPVLIDLGLGKRIEDSNQTHWQSTGDKGTLPWMAPEMMEHAIWNKKTDVYALGIIMWEVLTGKMPYADKIPVQIYKFVMDGGRPDTAQSMKEAGLSQARVNLIESLWHKEPSQRPTIEEFLELLDGTSALSHQSQHKLVNDAKCLVIVGVVILLAVVWLLLL